VAELYEVEFPHGCDPVGLLFIGWSAEQEQVFGVDKCRWKKARNLRSEKRDAPTGGDGKWHMAGWQMITGLLSGHIRCDSARRKESALLQGSHRYIGGRGQIPPPPIYP